MIHSQWLRSAKVLRTLLFLSSNHHCFHTPCQAGKDVTPVDIQEWWLPLSNSAVSHFPFIAVISQKISVLLNVPQCLPFRKHNLTKLVLRTEKGGNNTGVWRVGFWLRGWDAIWDAWIPYPSVWVGVDSVPDYSFFLMHSTDGSSCWYLPHIWKT